MGMLKDSYRVVPGPFYRPLHLALAARYATPEGAMADMSEGMVVTDGGRLVAFHEKHLCAIERIYALRDGQ